MSIILIITSEMDSDADFMICRLRDQGENPVRLHTQDFPQAASLSLSLEDDWRGCIKAQGREIKAESIRSVWWRRPGAYTLPDSLGREEAKFVSDELHQTLHGFFESLDCYWMSRPETIRRASYKLEQLKRAKAMGFEVPSTLVTMDAKAAQDFYERHGGNIIYKTFSQPIIIGNEHENERSQTVYAQPVSKEQLSDSEAIRQAPCLFQANIPKQLELRVTVIGDEVFTAAIHSQENSATQHDWRHYEVEIPYSYYELPKDIAERCLNFVKSYGLNFSAMDLVLTPDDRYVFLENNPNGQWSFIEHEVPELKMLNAIANLLVRGKA